MKHVHVYIGFGKCIQGIIEQLCLFCTSIRLNNINKRKNKLIYVKQLVEIEDNVYTTCEACAFCLTL